MIITYLYDDSADYNFDPADILVSDGNVRLTEPYSTDNPDITPWDPAETIGIGYLSGFSADVEIPAGSTIRYIVQSDGTEYYHDGAEWIESTGYSESNTVEQIEEYLEDFFLSDAADVRIIAYLHSDDGLVTPVLSELSFSYVQESYIGITYADRYCVKMGHSEWANLTDDAKREAILRAMQYIESRTFKGEKASAVQDLQFPRANIIYNGYELGSSDIPENLKKAVAEAAYLESQTPGILQPNLERGGMIISKTVDVLETQWADKAPARTNFIMLDGYLKGLTRSGSIWEVIRA